jgi:hypothetical protein
VFLGVLRRICTIILSRQASFTGFIQFLGHGGKNAPADHRDLHGVIYAAARADGMNK